MFFRCHRLALLALTISCVSLTVQSARAQDACAAVAADPSALGRMQDSPDFMAVLADMSKSCPSVLLALDLPTEMLAEIGLTGADLPKAVAADQDSNDRTVEAEVPPAEAEVPSATAQYLAMIDAASKKLEAAVEDVADARRVVDAALGNVQAVATRQAMVPEARTLMTKLGFGKYAAERREAVRALDAAKSDYAAAQANLTKVIDDTTKVVSDADAELAKANLAIYDVLEDQPAAEVISSLSTSVANAEAKIGSLKSDLDPLNMALAEVGTKLSAAQTAYLDAQTRYTVGLNRLIEIEGLCTPECTKELLTEADAVDGAVRKAIADLDVSSKEITEVVKTRNDLDAKKFGVESAIEGETFLIGNLRRQQESLIALDKAATDALTVKKAAEIAQTVQTDAARLQSSEAQAQLSGTVRAATDLLQVSEAEAVDAAALKAAAGSLDTAGLALDKAAQDARDVAKTVAADPSTEVTKAADALVGQAQEAQTVADSAADAVERAKAAEAENEAAKDALAEAVPPADV